jgi:poly(hydroxyalkanoate) depolymerase family esterase
MAKMDSLGLAQGGGGSGRLEAMTGFGSNPGDLVANCYFPPNLAPGAPLVVVLHGCTQNAAAYDQGSGWSQLADRFGFALLFPEQSRSNNHNLCFNWFSSGDIRRGQGEAASIAQMVRHMVGSHGLDPARVFINGLSAGGAMTAAMLATYPELFAGGAIIAGLPYGVADNVPQALERMRGQGMPSRRALANKIANASDHKGPWPTLSVWHGTADGTVVPANAAIIVDQWKGPYRAHCGWGGRPRRWTPAHGLARCSGRVASSALMSTEWATVRRSPLAARRIAGRRVRTCSRPGSARPAALPAPGA